MIKLKNILIGWYNKFFNKNKTLFKQRMEICNMCQDKIRLTKNEYMCKYCGCILSAKTRVLEESCDLNKW